MRIRAIAALVLLASASSVIAITAGCGVTSVLFKQYEYEEEMYLSLDGSAMLYLNSSIPALNALRGSTFDADPDAAVDTDAVRDFFASPVTRVTRVRTSRRRNRQYVHARIEVDDVRRLSNAGPFSWSNYSFSQAGDLFVYKQNVGQAAKDGSGPVEWGPDDLVAFRIHVPSKITYHTAGADNQKRGNILVWEQGFTDRLRGEPLALEARMETTSILYTTLYLFAGTFVAVAVLFLVVIWWILRRGRAAESSA